MFRKKGKKQQQKAVRFLNESFDLFVEKYYRCRIQSVNVKSKSTNYKKNYHCFFAVSIKGRGLKPSMRLLYAFILYRNTISNLRFRYVRKTNILFSFRL
jgi:hypothetical protein